MYGRIRDLIEIFNGKFTYKAITTKAKRLGLKSRSFWSNEEIEIMQNNYNRMSVDDIMKLLPNRTRHSIIEKAISLNLTNKVVLDTRFSLEEQEFVENNYQTLTDKEIANILHRTHRSINEYRFRHKLIKSYEKSSYDDLSCFVRRNNNEWKKDSMIACKYKCVLTGGHFDEIHHIHGLNLILNETLEKLNINIKPNMDDYTKDELKLILNTFREIQAKYPLGVCLTKACHKEFHDTYGYGDNTQEQWDEFIFAYK